mgnify:CR=1 FL=1
MIIRVDHNEAAPGSVNMELDLAMLNEVRTGAADIVFRTYTWDPWCVSLGRHQSIDAINADACASAGIDIVRRPTGGRAVLHANELTYGFAAKLSIALTPQIAYSLLHQALFAALAPHVSQLAFSGIPTDLRTHYASTGVLGQVCFTSHARSEIMCGTRKVVGSAQRVIDGFVLQHGSILCGPGHERIADLLLCEEAERSHLQNEIERSSVTLSDITNTTVTADDVVLWFTEDEVDIGTHIRRSFQSLPTTA